MRFHSSKPRKRIAAGVVPAPLEIEHNQTKRLQKRPSRIRLRCQQFWNTLCWAQLETAGDMLTVGFAVFDIIMDVWIAYTYYCDGRTGFFKLALGLLAIAQISYAALFVVRFADSGRPDSQILLFFLVLPFGQLVPLFIYAESLHFVWLTDWLRYFGLQNNSAPFRRNSEDLVLFKIRCKVESHMGFLVEACVEAVPQSVLQLVAMQHAGEANAFSVLSIVLSICCLASKGYVASFSIHFRTFVFGGMCVAADVLNMFASAAWLSSPSLLTPTAVAACAWWVRLAALTAALIGATGLSIALSEQARLYSRAWSTVFWTPIRALSDANVQSALMDIIHGTGLILLLAFPALVIMLCAKLALIPVVALRSLDALDAARSKSRPLFDWLMARDQHLRMYCTMRALLQCVPDEELRGGHSLIHSLAARKRLDLRSLMAEGDLTTQQLRAAAKKENRADLVISFWHMLSSAFAGVRTWKLSMHGTGFQWILITAFEVSMWIFGTLAVLSFAAFVLSSAMLPVVCVLSHALHGMCDTHVLEAVLCFVYLGLLGGMVFLVPSVVQFECFSDMLVPVITHVCQRKNRACDVPFGTISIVPHQMLDLDTIKRSYNGWIVNCQVQLGLGKQFGNGIPNLIHLAGKESQRDSLFISKTDLASIAQLWHTSE